MDNTEYIVQVGLPLPPSYSGMDPETWKTHTKNRKKLEKLIGHPVVLTGRSTANPNYKVKATFNTREAAQQVVDKVCDLCPQYSHDTSIITRKICNGIKYWG